MVQCSQPFFYFIAVIKSVMTLLLMIICHKTWPAWTHLNTRPGLGGGDLTHTVHLCRQKNIFNFLCQPMVHIISCNVTDILTQLKHLIDQFSNQEVSRIPWIIASPLNGELLIKLWFVFLPSNFVVQINGYKQRWIHFKCHVSISKG